MGTSNSFRENLRETHRIVSSFQQETHLGPALACGLVDCLLFVWCLAVPSFLSLTCPLFPLGVLHLGARLTMGRGLSRQNFQILYSSCLSLPVFLKKMTRQI